MKIISSRPRPHFVAWLLTAGALWVFERSYNYAPLFEIPGEVVALEATLIVLIWTAYHTYQGVLQTRRVAEREDTAEIVTRTSLCIALLSEVSILRDGLDVATREFITAEEASRFLPRPLLRHALERSELFSPSLASQITAVEGGLSIVEANLRTRDRLTGSLDSFVPSVERERQLKPELNETMKRLADSVGKAKSDLEQLDDLALYGNESQRTTRHRPNFTRSG